VSEKEKGRERRSVLCENISESVATADSKLPTCLLDLYDNAATTLRSEGSICEEDDTIVSERERGRERGREGREREREMTLTW